MRRSVLGVAVLLGLVATPPSLDGPSFLMAAAILRAVREATGFPGYPAVRDLTRK